MCTTNCVLEFFCAIHVLIIVLSCCSLFFLNNNYTPAVSIKFSHALRLQSTLLDLTESNSPLLCHKLLNFTRSHIKAASRTINLFTFVAAVKIILLNFNLVLYIGEVMVVCLF